MSPRRNRSDDLRVFDGECGVQAEGAWIPWSIAIACAETRDEHVCPFGRVDGFVNSKRQLSRQPP